MMKVLLVLLNALATEFPLPAIFVRVVFESFEPETISWEAKNAWAKCEGAIAGSVSWPPEPRLACAAMQMCANEATLRPEQYDRLVSEIRALPDCGDP
jgi:hypothetical protein